jgi:hypothetical protein
LTLTAGRSTLLAHSKFNGECSLPKSAVDIIGVAFEHTTQQLTRPFNFRQWVRLALLALATGELSSGGGCSRLSLPSRFPRGSQNFVGPSDVLRGIDPALIASLIMIALIGGLIVMLVWIYVSSVSRFILFESVLRKQCDPLSVGWTRWHDQGMSYFWWQLGLAMLSLGVAAVLFFPLLLPLMATLKNHQQPGPGWILAFVPVATMFAMFAAIVLLISVLAKDFVVPLMAIDGVDVLEGWRRLLKMMRIEKASYAGYLGMKIILAIGASVVFSIVSTIAALFVIVPAGIAGVVVVIVGKGAGLTWNAFTITIAIVAGTILIAVILYVIALACVPMAVFFPAYAMYFIAERFPALRARLYPPLPSVPLPPQPPPLAPAPGVG